ncbi:MAG: PIN domain-containing protein [Chloroflexota bacterium]
MNEQLFVDTNLFLRYLTNDVPAQADAVETLLRQAAAAQIQLVTNSLVLAEIVWTLESFYHLPKNDVQEKILAILNTPGLEVADGDLVLQAISWYVTPDVDFIDAYNAAWLLSQGLDAIYTFDRKHFNRLPGITVRAPGG